MEGWDNGMGTVKVGAVDDEDDGDGDGVGCEAGPQREPHECNRLFPLYAHISVGGRTI